MLVAALDDDITHLDLVRRSVEAVGHDCRTYERGQDLLRALRSESFDMLVVDWQLPDVAGIEIVRWVRSHLEDRIPIIFLTSRGEERDIVEGLSGGADDYMVKPIRVMELMARVQALMRRSYPQEDLAPRQYGGYRLDPARRTIEFDGTPVELKQKEFELARCLFANQGRLLSRSHLFSTVWGVHADLPSRTLDTHISSLRAKLCLRPERGFRLSAVYGQGYRLEAVEPAGGEPNEDIQESMQ